LPMSVRDISYSDLLVVIRKRGANTRSISALAGPPTAGKSTLAERLCNDLNAEEPGSAAILPMDGFHFDDAVLDARGWRSRKGAPHTFDALGYAHLLGRLRANKEDEIAVPVFDRGLEISRAGARLIGKDVRHLITEGNYLLLDEAPWSELAPRFDTTVFLDVTMDEIERRCFDRWRDMSKDARDQKINGNDLPNARLVLERSAESEFRLGG